MKQYESIDYFGDHWGLPVMAFDKLDGSNMRFEFSKKRGFYKFGTRNMMIDQTHPEFGFAVDLFLNKYGDHFNALFKRKEYRDILSCVCFAELHGTRSAFGQHDFGNDEFDITLFDVSLYKKGFVPPRQFIRDFGEAGIPRVVYEGNLNREFVEQVKRNEFGLVEGVICKGVVSTRKGNEQLYYCKIKTDDWFQRLREKSPQDFEKEMSEVKEK